MTYIRFFLDDEQQADWTSLLHVIATRANLEKVELWDAVSVEERTAAAGLVRAFLLAMQQNTAIRSVEMRWLRLSTDISTFVDNASSITSFTLCECDGEQGARSLAAALQRNTNIERLGLYNLNENDTIPILAVLGSKVSLKTFMF